MSDANDDFDDLVFDEAALGQIDEIETAVLGDGSGWGVPVAVDAGLHVKNNLDQVSSKYPTTSHGARDGNGSTGEMGNLFRPPQRKETTFQIRKPGGGNHNPAYRSPLPQSKTKSTDERTMQAKTTASESTSTGTFPPGDLGQTTRKDTGPRPNADAGPSRTRPQTSSSSSATRSKPSSSNRPLVLGKSQSSAIDLDGPIDLCSDDLYGDDGLDSLPMESLDAIDEMVQQQKSTGMGRFVQSELGFRSVPRSTNTTTINAPTMTRTGSGSGSGATNRNNGVAAGPVSLAPISSTTPYQTHLSFQPLGRKKKGKTWDRTQFSSTGGRGLNKVSADGKGSGKKKKKKRTVVSFLATNARDDGDDDEESEEEEEEVEGFDQFPLPFIDPNKPPPERKHYALPSIASTYLYPTNVPKRDYQYEIIASCLLDNTLVALPTGLGKTFIAGTVMLNFYRWFPRGKIVFLMPTKPLVTQQHEACQTTCGIPSADAATITGDDPEGWRDTAWSTKRVFYATPQTFLIDMAKGRLDPADIVLVIVDEAHKASGNHSYVQCISYLQAVHPYFRIVALTATPGRTTEKVQEVVDKLHISRIEIREAESPDIAKYMFKKNINHHPIELSAEFESLVTSLTELMEPLARSISSTGLMRTPDSRYQLRFMKPFTALMAMNGMFADKSHARLIGSAKQLYQLATALTHLTEYSLGMFFTALKAINGSEQSSSKGKTAKKPGNRIQNNKVFREMYQNTQDLIESGGQHPKFAKVIQLLGDHLEAKRVGSQSGENSVTRCMIFCSFREGVNELVEMLNKHPLIRAHKFVGRAQGKDVTDKGLTQKEQKTVIDKFKKNDYNCLVATSIGEEGLDIGEVDFIIIYNCPKTSIKALQRIGRAGRKRDGHIHVLATVGREDRNWDAAIFNHREIQSEIIIGANLELYDDAPPLLDRMPEPVLQRMEVDPWVDEVKNRGNKRKSRATAAKAPKRQRGAPVPEGIAGFVKASELTNKGKKTTAKRGKARQHSSEDDSDLDEDLPDLRDVTRTTNDSSDSEITTPPSKRRVTKKTPNKRTPRESATKRSNRTSYKNFSSSSDSEQDAPMEPERDDFFESVFGGPPLSSVTFPPSLDAHDSITNDNNDPQTTPLRPINGSTRHTQVSKTPATGHSTHSEFSQLDDRWMLDLDDDEFQPQMPGAQILAKPFKPPTLRATSAHDAMGPPASVQRGSAHTEQAADAPTSDASPIIVRRRGGNRVAIVASSEPDTPVTAEPAGFSPASLIHRTARPDSSPAAAPVRRRTKPANPRNIFVDDDVGVSDDDEDEDEEELSDVESESDRRFAGHFKATQAPKGYNQRRAYLAGLATQAPSDGPVFANRHHRHNDFLSKARRPILLSQEDSRHGPSSDYEGSFVCDDDEPVAYESASDEDMAA